MYVAVCGELRNINRIPGKDRIVSADVYVLGAYIATVIVGIGVNEGDKGLFFGSDCQISQEFCEKHNLLKGKGGYLDPYKRRVTAIRFAGVRSDGIFIPLPEEYKNLHNGDTVGEPLVKRYPLPVPNEPNTPNNKKRSVRVVNLPEHTDTPQMMYSMREIASIPIGAIITITEKLHGTSHRYGHVAEVQELPWYKKLINRVTNLFGVEWFPEEVFKHIHGSRRVILEDGKEGFYGSNAFRYSSVYAPLKRNEAVYGEIVGYAGDKPIMDVHKPTGELKALFGDKMVYDYGLSINSCKFYVYKIMRYNNVTGWQELSTNEVIRRSSELGYRTPVIIDRIVWDGNLDKLAQVVKMYAEGTNGWVKSAYGNHISEGVIIRFDHDGRTWRYKYKAHAFKEMEGIL